MTVRSPPNRGWRRRAIRSNLLLLLVAGSSACGHRAEILSFEAYQHHPHRVPYVLELQVGYARLLYFGSRHSYDPADPQMAQIEAEWSSFRPTRAFNEGGNPPVASSRDEAIAHDGEAGLLRYLAARDGIEIASLEPSRADEVAHVSGEFSPEQIKLFYVLREIPEMRAKVAVEPLTAYEERSLRFHSRVQALAGSPSTPAELEAACVRLLPPLQRCDLVPQSWFDPAPDEPTKAYTNLLSRRISEFRDAHMVSLLERALQGQSRVMAVVGSSHVVMQEPALRARQ